MTPCSEAASLDRRLQPVLAALLVGIVLALGAMAPVSAAARVPKVAIIVGPVGDITPRYKALANQAAAVARQAGAEVVKVYSPNATWPAVRAAITDASIVVYLGHGNGWPSRYRDALFPPSQNGFGLNPVAGVDDRAHQYFGEASVDNVHLARNAVVVLSHLCYASGNTEPGLPEGTLDMAVQRVDNYAAGFIRAGAAAVVAEAHMGPAWYVRQLLESKASIDSIWNHSPEAKGNVIQGNSARSPGFTRRLDPDHGSSGFYRSLVSRGVTTSQVRSGAVGTTRGNVVAGPPPIPSLAQSALKFGTLTLGTLPIAATNSQVSIPVTGNAAAIPAGAEVSIRWDPILLDAVPDAPAASPSPSPSPSASASPDPSTSPDPSASASPDPSATPSPMPTASPSSTPSPSPAATATPDQTPTVAHGLFTLPKDPVTPSPAPAASPTVVIPTEAPAVDLVVPERQGSVVEPVKAKLGANGLSLAVTFPTTPGLYRMVPTLHTPSGIAYDAATQALLTPVLVRIGGRIAVAYGAPAALTLAAGMEAAIPVRVLNSGSEPWDVSVTLQPGQAGDNSYHTSKFSAVLTGTWVSTTAAPVPPASSAELDPGIAGPGGAVSVSIAVTAPDAPGQYLLLLDTISPTRGPLSAIGSAPAIVRVTVTDAGPIPTPTAPQRTN